MMFHSLNVLLIALELISCSLTHDKLQVTEFASGYRPPKASCTHNLGTKVMRHSKFVSDLSVRACPTHSFSYLGVCPCFPGYSGEKCLIKLTPSNPYYVSHCNNLQEVATFDRSAPLAKVGGEYYSGSFNISYCSAGLHACAYLCYSNPAYGVAVVPYALWNEAQTAESALWKQVGQSLDSNANDRAAEHWTAFNMYNTLLEHQLTNLGRVIEVGAGPWTQLKALLHIRPEVTVQEFVIWEPGADKYMKTVTSCSYRDGKSLLRWSPDASGSLQHSFPVRVIAQPGEALTTSSTNTSSSLSSNTLSIVSGQQFDTLISINVIEHVQDAFTYLAQLYHSLRSGGLLILHERYYDNHGLLQGDRYHPVRIKRPVLDHFLSGFEILFNNCSASYDGRVGEQGYYIIAKKK